MRTALVADDEDSILALLEILLDRSGFDEVLTAHDGDEAARLFAAHGERLSLACLDVHMPGKGGLELLAAFRGSRPDLPVLVLGGDPEDGAAALAAGASAFTLKPFSVGAFLAELGALPI
jgi:two-component system response regulator TctD